MAQQPFMYLDTGDGWKPVNDHRQDIAALDDFTISWGADEPVSQPDPAVLTFELIDRAGDLAGKAVTLSGSRVLVQLSAEPTWDMLPDSMGAWERIRGTIAQLHQQYVPTAPEAPGENVPTLFIGTIGHGGTVTDLGNRWRIHLTATSLMVMWKRLQSQGPTSGEAKHAGRHWVGTPAARLAELNKRAQQAGAPIAEPQSLQLPPAVATYKTDDYPSQLDLLSRMYAHVMPAPAWYEHYQGETITLRPLSLAGSVQVHVGVDGMPYVLVDGQHRDTLPANLVAGDLELSIMEPVTQAVAKTKRAKNNDGVVEYDDMETVYTDLSRLPTRLTDTQKSVTADSDAVAGDDSGGLHTGGTFAPSDAQRQAAASWIITHDTRLRNESIKFIGTNLDPVSFPHLFRPEPSGPVLITGICLSTLTGMDGRPAFSGAFTTIGGRITFTHKRGMTHEATMYPLDSTANTGMRWQDFTDWPATFAQCVFTFAELTGFTVFDKPTSTTGIDRPNWEGNQE